MKRPVRTCIELTPGVLSRMNDADMTEFDLEVLEEKLGLFVDEDCIEAAKIVARILRGIRYGGLTDHDKDLIFIICSYDKTKDSQMN